MQNIAVNLANKGAPCLTSLESGTGTPLTEHQLNTDRLCLHPVAADDFNDYLALLSDPAVMRFIGIEAGYIPRYEEIEEIFYSALKGWDTRGYGRWSVFDSKSFEFMGFCGFRCEQGEPELIIALHERFWGQELAVEAAAACLNYGFKNFGFKFVKAFTRPNHFRARQVLKKLEADFKGYIDFHGVCGVSFNLSAKNYPNDKVIPS